MRNKAYYRYQHKKHALRHRRITREVYHEENYFNEFNKYDSFKIHCSCPICRGGYTKHGENTISDRRKLEEMKSQELDTE